jgi:thiol-disulfide isomerase/thioredoxin
MTSFGVRRHPGATPLPVEGRIPGFGGATGWLNSPPLAAEDMAGRVVLVDFWTYTCINWLRTLPYVRGWAEKYREHGLVVVGVHTPEFPFEHELENVRGAASALRVDYPIALDSDYRVWRAFGNRYWPAVYIADAEGRFRQHHFGEGEYDDCEWAIQMLLREAGAVGIGDDLVSLDPDGFEAQADWRNLHSPETYVGYGQGRNFASTEGAALDQPRSYSIPDSLRLNQWALAGDWTIESDASVLDGTEGRIAFRFHSRAAHVVLRARVPGAHLPFRVLLDGQPPGAAHGLDVDEQGYGSVSQPRLYQLLRQHDGIADRTLEIEFGAPGAEVYVFTFG